MFKALFGYRAVQAELEACRAAQTDALAEGDQCRRQSLGVATAALVRAEAAETALATSRYSRRLEAEGADVERIAALGRAAELVAELAAERAEWSRGLAAAVARAKKAEAELSVAVAEQSRIRCGFLVDHPAVKAAVGFALDRCRAECKQTSERFAADVAAALARAETADADLAASHVRETLLKKCILATRDALYLAADL